MNLLKIEGTNQFTLAEGESFDDLENLLVDNNVVFTKQVNILTNIIVVDPLDFVKFYGLLKEKGEI